MTSNLNNRRLFLPVLLFFIVATALLIAGQRLLHDWGIDPVVSVTGNVILFAATYFSLYLYQRAITHPSTNGFLRNTYSGLIVKLFVCIAGVFIYGMVAGSNINKQAIFVCVFLYFVYTIIEMRSLLRWNKERNNA